MTNIFEQFEKFSFFVSEGTRYLHKLSMGEAKEYNLKASHALILLTVSLHNEALTASKLAETSGKDKGEVSRSISTLIEHGLLEKPSNSYRAKLKLTENGKNLASALRKKANLAVELASNDLTDDELTVFYKTFEIIISNLKEISDSGILPKK